MVNDIQNSNIANHALLRGVRGLKNISMLFSKDKTGLFQSLKEGIKHMFKSRFSYNPETYFNKALSILSKPTRSCLKYLGLGNPGSEKSAYVEKFMHVTKETNPDDLEIPGYDSFKALSRDTQIAMLGGDTYPNQKAGALGLYFIQANSVEKVRNGIEEEKKSIIEQCKTELATRDKAKEGIAEFEKKKDANIPKPGDKPEDKLKKEKLVKHYDNLISEYQKEINRTAERDKKAIAQRDEKLKVLDEKLSAHDPNIKTHQVVDQLFQNLPPNIKASIEKYGAVIDRYSGMTASLLYDPAQNTIHIVFGGTNSGNDIVGGRVKGSIMNIEQISNDITTSGILSNHVPPSYEQARDLVGAIKAFKESHDLDMTIEVKGFSMGGGMAAYAGMYHGVKALSHCGAPVSPACQRSLGSEKMEEAVAQNKIFNTSVEGDWVTNRPKIQAFARGFEKITGLQVARHIGNGLRLSGEGLSIPDKDGKTQKWGDIESMNKHPWSYKLFKEYEPYMEKTIEINRI